MNEEKELAIAEKRDSNLDDLELVQHHSETINGQEVGTQNEISRGSEIGESAISNSRGWKCGDTHLIWTCRFRR